MTVECVHEGGPLDGHVAEVKPLDFGLANVALPHIGYTVSGNRVTYAPETAVVPRVTTRMVYRQVWFQEATKD